MKALLVAVILFASVGCKRKLAREEIEIQLKKSMHTFLMQQIKFDSSRVKFDVQQVKYFEDRNFYECEFVVHMIDPGHDTTGEMMARISKDFSIVKRKL